MNAQRRKVIAGIVTKLQAMQLSLDEIKDEVSNVLSEERDAFDALPESQQDGDKGEKMSNAIDSIEEVFDAIDNFNIEDMVTLLEEASE